MAKSVVGSTITNMVVWKEDIRSRKRVFANLKRYKKVVDGINKSLAKMGGLQQLKASGSGTGTRSKPATDPDARRKRDEIKAYAEERLRQERAQKKASREADSVYRFEQSAAFRKLGEMLPLQQKIVKEDLEKLRVTQGTTKALITQTRVVRELLQKEKESLRVNKQKNFVLDRSVGSMKQMAASAVSVFAVMEGIGAVARTGMDLQKVENSMLSVSKSTDDMKANMEFVRANAKRLGGDLVQNSKAFSQLLANQGDMGKSDVNSLFTGITELSTSRGLTADETAGSVRALTQMMGKTKIMAEELRGQLAERLPGSVQIFAEAAKDAGLTDGSVVQLNKLMEDGKAYAKDILPFVAVRLQQAARKNDALESSMKSLTVAFGKSRLELQDFQNELFGRGVERGIKTLLTGFQDLMQSSKQIASFLGGVFEGAVFGLTLPFRTLYAVVYDITKLLGMHSSKTLQNMVQTVTKLTSAIVGLGVALFIAKKGFGALKGIGKIVGAGFGGGKNGKNVSPVYVTNMPVGGLGGDTLNNGGKKQSKLKGTFTKVAGATLLYPIVDAIMDAAIGDTAFGKWAKNTTLGDVGTSINNSFSNPNKVAKSGRMRGNTTQEVKISLDSNLLSAEITKVAEHVTANRVNEFTDED